MNTVTVHSAAALFLPGLVGGFIVQSAILAIRGLAQLVLWAIVVGLVAFVAIEGWEGALRWLDLALEHLASAGPLFTGVAVGKLLAGALRGGRRS